MRKAIGRVILWFIRAVPGGGPAIVGDRPPELVTFSPRLREPA